jgi:hypothetical protein
VSADSRSSITRIDPKRTRCAGGEFAIDRSPHRGWRAAGIIAYA